MRNILDLLRVLQTPTVLSHIPTINIEDGHSCALNCHFIELEVHNTPVDHEANAVHRTIPVSQVIIHE